MNFPQLPLESFTRASDDCDPVAVVAATPGRPVVAVNTCARQTGANVGEPIAGALSRIPSLRVLQREPEAESALLETLACRAYTYTPAISIAPDRLLLEIGSCLKLFGGPEAIMRQLHRDIAAFGLSVRMACAPTPLAATWLSMSEESVCLTPDQNWHQQLDELPCEVLALDGSVHAKTLDWLSALGVETIGQLDRLPAKGLARRGAGAINDLLARARGQRPDPRAWFHPPARFASRICLPAPEERTEPLMFAAGRLTQMLEAWLRPRNAGVDRCTLTLETERSGHEHCIELVTSRLAWRSEHLLILIREHLVRQTLQAPVQSMSLHADRPIERLPRNQDLFETTQHPHRDTDVIDRLRARLGSHAVSTLQPMAEHRPEHAWRCVPPGHPVKTPAHRGLPAFHARPCWLLEQPRPLHSIEQLRLERGPERIECGWWDGNPVRRDYYVARTAANALWWIYRTRGTSQPRWYVHGYFA